MRFTNVAILICFINSYLAQNLTFFEQSDSLNNKRIKTILIVEATSATASILLLNEIWYKNYPKSKFHFFDDSHEWLQMDKLGHITTSYYIGLAGIEAMKWSGLPSPKRAWLGGTLGLFYLTGVEILDGTSAQWGFSPSDFLADALGSGLVIGQDLAWQEQRIRLKISAHLSPYAQFRPNLLGSTPTERLLKDYNGQTIWLSINPSSFLSQETLFPKWLNIALGYGAQNLLSGEPDIPVYYQGNNIQPLFQRYRQYYLSLDIDLTRTTIKNPILKALTRPFGLIKIPFPALEYSQGKFTGHWFYF